MQWIDDAIILSVRKFGESKALVRVFAKNHGVNAGIVRGATSKNIRGILQVGNAVNVTWQARLSEQMGAFKIEPVKPFAAFAMQDKLKLAALTSACALMETSLPERHPYPKLYQHFWKFLEVLAGEVESWRCGDGEKRSDSVIPTSPHPHIPTSNSWQQAYVKLELEILAESGFGLDLTQCAATGTTDNLMYVSPKSGRAVSEAAGEPYKGKLLPLPEFLLPSPLEGEGGAKRRVRGDSHKLDDGVFGTTPPPYPSLKGRGDTLEGLTLTGYFLEEWLAAPHGKKLPAARARLIDLLQDQTRLAVAI